MRIKLQWLRPTVAMVLVLAGIGAVLNGCYYVVPAYPPPPGTQVPQGAVYVPGRWVWNGYAWVWQPGYWTAPIPLPVGQTPPPPGPAPQAPATPGQRSDR
jgi:WXXGXW repeat (2 copies)